MRIPTPDEIRLKRKRLNIAQSEVAQEAGLDISTVGRIETGKVDTRLSTLRKVINALEKLEECNETILAEDIMTSDIQIIKPSDSIQKCINLMVSNDFSQLPVVKSDVPVGMINMKQTIDTKNSVSVKDVMDNTVISVSKKESIQNIRPIFDDHDVVLVTESGMLIGIITQSDIIKNI